MAELRPVSDALMDHQVLAPASEDTVGDGIPGRRVTLENLLRSGPAVAGTIVLLLFIIMSALAPVLAPYKYSASGNSSLSAPTGQHWFGTDDIGRDVLSRVVYGGQTTLLVAVISVLVAICLGTFIGLFSAYHGGWIDSVVMRIIDIIFAFPAVLLAIALVAVLGPSVRNLIIVLSILLTPRIAVVIRAGARKIRYQEFVEAAQYMDLGALRINLRHVLPNLTSIVLVESALSMSAAILTEAALSFLGLGPPPPSPTWGGMVAEAASTMTIAPWTVIFPGLAILLLVLSLNLVADGLEERLSIRVETNV